MRVFLIRLLLLVFSIALALAGLELALRFVEYDRNPAPQWRFHPQLGWTISSTGTKADEITTDGFRYRPLESRSSPTRTLLVLGDSFTAGMTFPFLQTYPGILESRLNQEGREWEVVSRAVDDWGSTQQLLALREFFDQWDRSPDAIVLQVFPFNDFCNDAQVLACTCSLQDSHRPYFTISDGVLVLTWLEPWRAFFRNGSFLFGFVENQLATQIGQLPENWQPDRENQDERRRSFFLANAREEGLKYEGAAYALLPEEYQPPVIQEAWRVVERVLEEISQLADEYSVPLIPVIIPFSKTLSEEDWQKVLEALKAPMEREFGTTRFEEIFRSMGVEPISVRREIENGDFPREDYFISPADGHLSYFGHQQVAGWILARLK